MAGRLDQLIYLKVVLAILFPSCFFKSVLNGISDIGKHPRYIRMSPTGKMAGFSLQELTKPRRTTHSKIEL